MGVILISPALWLKWLRKIYLPSGFFLLHMSLPPDMVPEYFPLGEMNALSLLVYALYALPPLMSLSPKSI